MRNREEYLRRKRELKKEEFRPRENCSVCGFAKKTCYCHLIKNFDPHVIFVILIHKLEIDRKIATGRLSHLVLKKSLLVPGSDYSQNDIINELIDNHENHCVVLYPGKITTNLSQLTALEKNRIAKKTKMKRNLLKTILF